MSLVKTLGRIAVGVMVAKGAGKMMGRRGSGAGSNGPVTRSGGTGSDTGGGLGGLLGSMLGGGSSSGTGGGLGGTLGSLLGGQSSNPRSSRGGGGGLGDIGALLGGRSGSGAAGRASSSGLSGGLAGGLGGLLERMNGGTSSAADGDAGPANGSFGDLFNKSLNDEPVSPDAGQEAHARLLIQAMINAAKSDGNIDEDERARIVEHLGDAATEEEREFVFSEMRAPLDVEGFIAAVPRGAEKEVYTMSVMGIDLDEQSEARYLDELRKGFNLSEQDVDEIHEQLGVPTLYR